MNIYLKIPINLLEQICLNKAVLTNPNECLTSNDGNHAIIKIISGLECPNELKQYQLENVYDELKNPIWINNYE